MRVSPQANTRRLSLGRHLDRLQESFTSTVEEISSLAGRFQSATGTEVEQLAGNATALNLLAQTFDKLIEPVSAQDLGDTGRKLQLAAQRATDIAVGVAGVEQRQIAYAQEYAALEGEIASAPTPAPTQGRARGRGASRARIQQFAASEFAQFDTPEKIDAEVRRRVQKRLSSGELVAPTAADFQIGLGSLLTPEDAALLRNDPVFQEKLTGRKSTSAPPQRLLPAGDISIDRPKQISEEIRKATKLLESGRRDIGLALEENLGVRRQIRGDLEGITQPASISRAGESFTYSFSDEELASIEARAKARTNIGTPGEQFKAQLSVARAASVAGSVLGYGTGEEQFRAIQSLTRASLPAGEEVLARRNQEQLAAIQSVAAAGNYAYQQNLGKVSFDKYGRYRGDIFQGLQAFHRSTGTPIGLDAGLYARAIRPDGGLGNLISTISKHTQHLSLIHI